MVDSAVAVVGRNGTERAEIDLRELLGYKNGLSLPPLWLSTSTELFQVSVLAHHVNLTNLEGIRYDDRVE